jgi:hypothetical protein
MVYYGLQLFGNKFAFDSLIQSRMTFRQKLPETVVDLVAKRSPDLRRNRAILLNVCVARQ